jgi:hypothetical protein
MNNNRLLEIITSSIVESDLQCERKDLESGNKKSIPGSMTRQPTLCDF